MRYFKKLAPIIVIVLALSSFFSCGNSKDNPKKNKDIVASIDSKNVFKEDVSLYYDGLKNNFIEEYGNDYENNEKFKELYVSLVQQYVQEKTLLKYAEDKKSYDESDIESKVDLEMENMKETFPTDEAFEEAIKNTGFKDEDDYRDKLKNSTIIYELLNNSSKDIKVSENDIKLYYDENKDQYKKGPGANVYHILVPNETLAEEVLTELDSGEDFADLAQLYSTDGTSSLGGSLGYCEYDNSNLLPEFMDVVKELEEGEISEPLLTQYGYHIIKVENVQTDEFEQDYSDVKQEIERNLKAKKMEDQVNEIINDAMDKYKVKVYEENIMS